MGNKKGAVGELFFKVVYFEKFLKREDIH